MAHLEISLVALVHCNIVKNDYQHDSRFVYTFVLNKSFGQLLNISIENFLFLKTFNASFSILKYAVMIKNLIH